MKRKSGNFSTFDEVINAFSEPVIIINASGSIVESNQAMRDLLKLNPAGTDFTDFFQSITPEQAGTFIKGEGNKSVIYSLKDKNGDVMFFSCSGASVSRGENGEGTILVWDDLTEIIRNQQQLSKSNMILTSMVNRLHNEQKTADSQILKNKLELSNKNFQLMVSNKLLEIIFSNTHFLIAYLTPDFMFIQVNDAYARAFNQKPEFFIHKNYFDLFPHAEVKAIFENVVKTGNSYITYADRFSQEDQFDSDIAYWDWSLQAIKNNNEVEGIILVQIDVTRRKKTEKNLIDVQRLSDIGMLAATVAHELRNPLGVIKAAIYNIKKKRLNTDVDKHIENIETEIEDSEQIINNLLLYSKFKIPVRNRVSLNVFLEELFNDIRNKNVNPDVELITKCGDLKKEIVCIDPLQIREVLNNIVNNAYQALPCIGGRIEIQGRLSGKNQWQLSVTDNGDGMDNQTRAKIFDPFFTCRSRGTGLGLTICKELIKLHHGRIEVQSRKGQGTSVTIILPLGEMD